MSGSVQCLHLLSFFLSLSLFASSLPLLFSSSCVCVFFFFLRTKVIFFRDQVGFSPSDHETLAGSFGTMQVTKCYEKECFI